LLVWIKENKKTFIGIIIVVILFFMVKYDYITKEDIKYLMSSLKDIIGYIKEIIKEIGDFIKYITT